MTKTLHTLSRMKRVAKGRHWFFADHYDYYFDSEVYRWMHQKLKYHYGFKKRWVGDLPF